MIPIPGPDVTIDVDVIRRAERDDRIDDRRLRKAIAAGVWTRIVPGVFVRTTDWAASTPIERHRLRVVEALRRFRTSTTLGHHAAAALWGIDIVDPWPRQVDVLQPPARGGRSSGNIRRHFADVPTLARVPLGRHAVTSAAQTALDLARVLPFENAVAIVDQAVWTGRADGPLTTVDEIFALMVSSPHRGDARALRALAFANPGAANVQESRSRVLIARLGFPQPRVQERRVLRSGRLVFGDFYFPDQDHWGELDGRGKYTDPRFAAGRTPQQIVIDEKNRENEIRREVRGFSRWEAADITPRRLYDILAGDGLASSLPRP